MNDAGWDSASKRLSGRRRFGVVCLQLKALVFLPRGLAEGVRKVHSEGLKLFTLCCSAPKHMLSPPPLF